MRVAVVDDQRDAAVLRDPDVRPERGLLRRPALGPGAVAVQPGLPDGPHPRQRRQPVDLGERVVGRLAGPGLVGMQRDGGQHVRVPARPAPPTSGTTGRRPRPAPAAARSPRRRPRSRRRRRRPTPTRRARRRPAAPPGRCRGACGCPAPGRAAAPGTAAARPACSRGWRRPTHRLSSSRRSSSSTIESSSFVNTGVGGASGIPGLERPGRPDRLRRVVVAGDDRVGRAVVEVGDLLDPRRRRPDARAAEQLVHLLRRVRQERGEQRVAVADRLQRGEQHGVPAGRVLLELPRRLVGQVLVRLADDPHRLGGGGLLPVPREQVADRAERSGRRGQQRRGRRRSARPASGRRRRSSPPSRPCG